MLNAGIDIFIAVSLEAELAVEIERVGLCPKPRVGRQITVPGLLDDEVDDRSTYAVAARRPGHTNTLYLHAIFYNAEAGGTDGHIRQQCKNVSTLIVEAIDLFCHGHALL